MAGIGFSLKRLFSQKGVFALCRAYGYAGVICAGPMVLGVLLLTGMSLVSRLAGIASHERELMNSMLTYSILWSLVVTSWLNMVVTRYIADMIYQEKPETIMPAFYGSTSIMLVIAAVSYGTFLHFSGIAPIYRLECLWFSLILVVVWSETIFLTALKDFKSIVLAFAVSLMFGFIIALLSVIYGKASVSTLMFCVIISYGMLMVWYYKLLADYFPNNSGSKFTFLRWLDRYWKLALIGGFSNIGLYAHIVIMYFGPLRVQVEGLFYGAPPYDAPALIAFFSILITTVNFVTSVEVRFYPKYRDYYSLFNENGSVLDIERANKSMINVLKQEMTYSGHKQLVSTVLFVVFGSYIMGRIGMGFNELSVGIFRFLCAGYGLYALSNTIMLTLLYFEDYFGALLGTAAFAVVGVGASVASILWAPTNYYGLGFVCAGAAYYIIVWIRLEWYLRRLPYFLLCRQAVVPVERHGPMALLCNFLDGRQERLEEKKRLKLIKKADKRRESNYEHLQKEMDESLKHIDELSARLERINGEEHSAEAPHRQPESARR